MNHLLKMVENIFLELGFQYKTIGDRKLQYLCYGDCYCRITYIDKFKALVIESADDAEDAAKGVLEDGELYHVDTPEEELLRQLRADIKRYYMT